MVHWCWTKKKEKYCRIQYYFFNFIALWRNTRASVLHRTHWRFHIIAFRSHQKLEQKTGEKNVSRERKRKKLLYNNSTWHHHTEFILYEASTHKTLFIKLTMRYKCETISEMCSWAKIINTNHEAKMYWKNCNC